MLDKMGAAVKAILTDLSRVKADVSALKNRPAPKPGEPGISPDIDAIIEKVVARLPAPTPGKNAVPVDVDAVAYKVLACIDKPKDGEPGKDAIAPAMADIVGEVLAKIPKPKDGEPGDSVDVNSIVSAVLAKMPAPKIVAADKRMAPVVKNGKNGVSITKVKLEKGNKLAVWLDGVRRLVGTIEIPKPAASFTPATASGGGHKTTKIVENPFNPTTGIFMERLIEGTSLAADQQPAGRGIDNALPVEFGAAIGNGSDPAQMDVDGKVTFNVAGMYRIKVVFQFGRTGGSQTAEILFRFLVNGTQIGRSVGVKLGNAEDLRYIDIDNWFNVPQGATLETEIMRDLAGNDSGGLFRTVPTNEGAGTWNNVPCAVIRVERLVGAP